VSEYTEQYYIPAAKRFLDRAAEKGAEGAKVVEWVHSLERKWANLRFGEVKVETGGEQHLFEVRVYLNGLDPDCVNVELYADGLDGGGPERYEMTRERQLVGAEHGYVYSAQVSAVRPADAYTARMAPRRAGVAVPLETAQILWQR
jgi:starch phosphorylase